MTKTVWDIKELGEVRRSSQDKFVIQLKQLDILSSDEWEIEKEYNFGNELLSLLSDHLSLNNIREIVDVFSAELKVREKEREDKILKRLHDIDNELNYIRQLRPLVPMEDKPGYSKAISFEQMSEYAIKYMEEHGLYQVGTQWERG